MPRKYARKSDRAKWTEVDLQTARELVQISGWSIRKAAAFVKIPEATLRNRFQKDNFEKKSLGPSSYLKENNRNKNGMILKMKLFKMKNKRL
jgi:hypothetical protein